ncbi:MAG: GTPase Era [Coriobacteriales bacterium]|nr:GTPase Era [Coriobacteriales bacterium]
MLTQDFHSGFVSLVARPNAGKSTLTNAVVGDKVAITSEVAQTTRHNITAILTRDDFQLVLQDTPGLHKPKDNLGQRLNDSALQALIDGDMAAFLLDATAAFGRGDEWVLRHLLASGKPWIAVLTKCALPQAAPVKVAEALNTCLGGLSAKAQAPLRIIKTSALEGEGVEEFIQICAAQLPLGPLWYPADAKTGQNLETQVAELVREQALRATFDELPHAIGVALDGIGFDKRKQLYRIYVNLYVERKSQKGLLIGRGGAKLKQIGSAARLQLEQLLKAKVYLELQVKLRKNWRRDLNQIKRFGYGTV